MHPRRLGMLSLLLLLGCTPRDPDAGTMVGNPGSLTAAEVADGQLRTLTLPVDEATVQTCDGGSGRVLGGSGAPLTGTLDLTGPVSFSLEREGDASVSVCGIELRLGAPVTLELLGDAGEVLTATLDVDVIQLDMPAGDALPSDAALVLELAYPGWVGQALVGLRDGSLSLDADEPISRQLAEAIAQRSALYVDADGDGALSEAERDAGPRISGAQNPAEQGVSNGVALVGEGGVIGRIDRAGIELTLVRDAVDGGPSLQRVAGGPLGAIAVGSSSEGGRWAETSADLTVWSETDPGTSISLGDVVFGGGRYVVVGVSNQTFSSVDLQTWTAGTAGGFDLSLYAVTYGDGLFVAGGEDDGGGLVLTSADGISWSEPIRVSDKVTGLAWGEGRFVATGIDQMVLTSDDGEIWTPRTFPTADILRRVRHVEGAFVVVAGDNEVFESPTGGTWTFLELGFPVIDLIHTGTTHLALGPEGAIRRSPDRRTWTLVQDGDGTGWLSAASSGR